MPINPLGLAFAPLTNPRVAKLTHIFTLIEQKPIGFRVSGTHCHLYLHWRTALFLQPEILDSALGPVMRSTAADRRCHHLTSSLLRSSRPPSAASRRPATPPSRGLGARLRGDRRESPSPPVARVVQGMRAKRSGSEGVAQSRALARG